MEKFLAALAAVIVLLLSSVGSAQAGVIYRWMDATPDPEAGRIDAFIEFGSDVWSMGGTLNARPADFNPDTLEAYFGIESIFFGLRDGVIDTINWSTGTTCADHASSFQHCSGDLSADTRVITLGLFSSWAFDLTMGETLTGSIAINDGSSDFRMSSLDALWTVARLGSDQGPTCFNPGVCSGGTGSWVLDNSSVPMTKSVPEPASWSLLLLGAAAWQLRRRKARG